MLYVGHLRKLSERIAVADIMVSSDKAHQSLLCRCKVLLLLILVVVLHTAAVRAEIESPIVLLPETFAARVSQGAWLVKFYGQCIALLWC